MASSKTASPMKLLKALTILAEAMDRDAPISQALVLATVAAAGPDGVEQQAVQDRLHLSTASITRTVQTLSDLHFSKEKAGYGLIQRTMSPEDNRKKILKLTRAGEVAMAKLAEAL